MVTRLGRTLAVGARLLAARLAMGFSSRPPPMADQSACGSAAQTAVNTTRRDRPAVARGVLAALMQRARPRQTICGPVVSRPDTRP